MSDNSSCVLKDISGSKKVSTYLECGNGYCQKIDAATELFDNGILKTKWIWSKSNFDNCPFSIPYFSKNLGNDEGTYFHSFQFIDYDKKNEFVKVKTSEKTYAYLDVKFCKQDQRVCSFCNTFRP